MNYFDTNFDCSCLYTVGVQIVSLFNRVKSFTELGPKLLKSPGEVFSQDPLERYFSRQHHRRENNDNPTAHQVPYNAATLATKISLQRLEVNECLCTARGQQS